ncbi:extracellular solute-binding protein [Streptomyces sp. NPDC060194]|uniref:extracellular solute-binding protein n=1 Tax=Streptomyces sp. NPDC060194 TaxID=3347069 RepID=UPI003653BD57
MTLGLSGCGGGGVGSGDVNLTMIVAEYGEPKKPNTHVDLFWSQVVEEYESTHPGTTITVKPMSWSVVDKTVKELVEKGEAPDMAQIGGYSDFAAEGKLYSADELLSIPTQADFLPKLAQAGELNRVQYGMPFASSTRALFYNKKMFRDAGLSAPTTWEELKSAAQTLKAQGVQYPYALPLGYEEAQAETMLWTLSADGGYTDSANSYAIASKENVKTLTWLRDNLVTPGLVGPVPAGKLDRQAAFTAFEQGKVGMLNGHPTLMKNAERAGVEVGKVAIPGPKGPAQSTMAVADWMMGFKQNGHRKEIGEFLDFLYQPKNILAFSKKYDILPVTNTAFQKMSDDPKHKDLKTFLEALPNAQLPPVNKTTWPSVAEAVKKSIGGTVAKDGDPESVLGRIERDATAAENAE